jgi:DNA replication protein DnaC
MAALKQRGRKVPGVALRQLLRLVREYPREPLLAAVREAARYGLYDLDRLERMILRRVAREYFCSPTGATGMTEELEQLLKNLKLRRMREVYEEQLRAAEKDDVSYSEFCHAPGARAVVRAARGRPGVAYPARQSARALVAGDVSFARQPGVNCKRIHGFAELDFIAKAENIVLVGPTGVGKTGLSCGLVLKALQNGYRCQFIRAQDLFDEMYASLADRSARQLLKRLRAWTSF